MHTQTYIDNGISTLWTPLDKKVIRLLKIFNPFQAT